MDEVFAARDQRDRWARTLRAGFILMVVGIIAIGFVIGLNNSKRIDDIDGANEGRSRTRTAQEACAQNINAEWASAFGQAAVSPTGSPERAYWAARALEVRSQLDHIDVLCFGVVATTATSLPVEPTTLPFGTSTTVH